MIECDSGWASACVLCVCVFMCSVCYINSRRRCRRSEQPAAVANEIVSCWSPRCTLRVTSAVVIAGCHLRRRRRQRTRCNPNSRFVRPPRVAHMRSPAATAPPPTTATASRRSAHNYCRAVSASFVRAAVAAVAVAVARQRCVCY